MYDLSGPWSVVSCHLFVAIHFIHLFSHSYRSAFIGLMRRVLVKNSVSIDFQLAANACGPALIRNCYTQITEWQIVSSSWFIIKITYHFPLSHIHLSAIDIDGEFAHGSVLLVPPQNPDVQ